MRQILLMIRGAAVSAALVCIGIVTAAAESLDSTIADTRTLAAFKVNEEVLTDWLPETHAPAPYGSGAFQGANILMMFIDRMLHQDAEGVPKNGGAYRMMALIVPGRDKENGEKATFIARVYSPGDSAGPYKTAVKSSVRHALTLEGADVAPLSGRHHWRVEHGGGAIEIAFDYEAGVPGRRSGESTLSTPADAGVKRIYRFDQLTDVIFSKPKDVDRSANMTVVVTIPELAEMFDGSEELIGVADRPFYTRTTWKP